MARPALGRGDEKALGASLCDLREAKVSRACCHFDLLGDEVLLVVLAYVSAADLVALGSTARRFSQPTVVVPPVLPPADADVADVTLARSPVEICSLVEAAARQHVQRNPILEQQRVLRRDKEPWVALMRELELLAKPVVFTDADQGIMLSHAGAVATDCSTYMEHLPVVCGRVAMRSGLHYAELTSLRGCTAMYGVVGADFEAARRIPAWKSQNGWMFGCYDGRLYHACTYRDWPGMRRTQVGDVVGLLLDLNTGSLAVYVNGARLGLMVESGLRGPLCWVADLYSSSISGINTVRVGDAQFADILAQAQMSTATTPVTQVQPSASRVSDHSAMDAEEAEAPSLELAAHVAMPVTALLLPPVTMNTDTLENRPQPSSPSAVELLAVGNTELVGMENESDCDCGSGTARDMQLRTASHSDCSQNSVLPPDWFDGPMAVDPNTFYTKWLLYAFLSAGPGVGIVWNWSNHCDGVYGLSLYIDVHGDPESWNCVGNLGILGLGWGVVASFHALRKVVRVGDGALAKLKVVNSTSSRLERGAGTSTPQLRLLSVGALQNLKRWRLACIVWCGLFCIIGIALLVPGLFTTYPLTALLRVFLGAWVIVALGVVPAAWFLSLKLGSALADAALAADENARSEGMAVATTKCQDHASHGAEMQIYAGLSINKLDPTIDASAPKGACEDCEAQLHLPRTTFTSGVELTPDDNDPHSPARLSEWETSLIVMAIGALTMMLGQAWSTYSESYKANGGTFDFVIFVVGIVAVIPLAAALAPDLFVLHALHAKYPQLAWYWRARKLYDGGVKMQ